MKQIRRRMTALAAAVLLLAAAGCQPKETAEEKEHFTIGIVQIMEHAALDSAREGFVKALADNGITDGANATLDIQNAQGDQSNLSTIGDRFVSAGCSLICAIATPSAQAMAGKTAEIPILATAVTDYVSTKLVESNEKPGGNVSGTSDMNPIKEQIALLFELFPNAQTVGCIYNNGEDNSVLQAGIAKTEIEALGKTYTEVTVTSTNDVQQAMQTLVTRCDAIYIPTDNTLASAMPIVSDVANAAKIPTICGENNMVTAGGLASLGVNYFDLGYQTGLMAVKILKEGADIASMPVEFATGFDSAINGESAAAIGLTVPDKYKDAVG